MEEEKNCQNCFYARGHNTCKVLNERIEKDCKSWADEAEAKRRESAIRVYSGKFYY